MARVSIDDQFMKQLQTVMRTDSAATVTQDALTLLNWAVSEVKAGRTIFSANKDATDIHKLAMPSLMKLQSTSA
jgi:hypothetical protein